VVVAVAEMVGEAAAMAAASAMLATIRDRYALLTIRLSISGAQPALQPNRYA
jgi:hypothetical protein